MKKQILMVAALFLGAMTFSACGSDSDDNGGGSGSGSSSGSTSKYAKMTKSTTGSSAEAGDDGTFCVKFKAGDISGGAGSKGFATDGLDGYKAKEFVYKFGKFHMVGNTYALEGFGNMTFSGSGNNLTATIVTTSGQKITWDAGQTITITGKEQAKIAEDATTVGACRAWKIVNTTFTYKEEGSLAIGHSFQGANLTEMGEWLMENHHIDIMDELAEKESIESVVFTQRGSFIINFANDVFCGTWKWNNKSKGTFTYEWDDPENMTTNFDNGTGTVKVENGKARLDLQGSGVTNAGKPYNITLNLFLELGF